jgi:hypothetical protein
MQVARIGDVMSGSQRFHLGSVGNRRKQVAVFAAAGAKMAGCGELRMQSKFYTTVYYEY